MPTSIHTSRNRQSQLQELRSAHVQRAISTAVQWLLPLLLLLLLRLDPAASQFAVTVDRVSGCMDVGTATDNCTGGQLITIYGTNFALIPSSLNTIVNLGVCSTLLTVLLQHNSAIRSRPPLSGISGRT